jgi:hypothetical protein
MFEEMRIRFWMFMKNKSKEDFKPMSENAMICWLDEDCDQFIILPKTDVDKS